MKLYTYYRSSAAYRVRIALNIKELAVLYIPKHLLREGGEHQLDDYLALNPQGLVPALEHEGRVIGQSLTDLYDELIQAGRELRVLVESDKVSDDEAVLLSKDIARKIEESLNFPGQIKVTVIRETRAVELANK